MGLPPVVAGLLVSLILWRNGPLGGLGLLYSPTAMVIAQAAIASPIVAGLTLAAVSGLDPRYRLQLRALGASRLQTAWWLLREARIGVVAAVVAGFGAIISEVGAAMMVGGNIKGETRVLTTATVLEVGRGNFETAIALSSCCCCCLRGDPGADDAPGTAVTGPTGHAPGSPGSRGRTGGLAAESGAQAAVLKPRSPIHRAEHETTRYPSQPGQRHNGPKVGRRYQPRHHLDGRISVQSAVARRRGLGGRAAGPATAAPVCPVRLPRRRRR
jgi:hypothetical protein